MPNKILNYRMFGNGHPVVFLHGFLESHSMWDYLNINSLKIKAVLVDLPGHGFSLNEDEDIPSIKFMALKVEELLVHLNIHEFSVVGHSMGGYVALELKEMNPFYSISNINYGCTKVVLLNSNFWEDSDLKKKERLRIVDVVFKNKKLFIQTAVNGLFLNQVTHKNEIENLIKEALNIDKHAISYASLAMRNRQNFKKLVSDNNKDFLIIQGDLDSVVPKSKMLEEINGLNIRFEFLKNCGHMCHIEASDSVTEILADFLDV